MSGGAYSVSLREKDPQKFALAIQGALNGRSNASGSCTLAAGATSTTVNAPNCGQQSAVFLFAKTAHGAAELAAGGCFISSVGRATFTITHANNAQTDREFFFVALG